MSLVCAVSKRAAGRSLESVRSAMRARMRIATVAVCGRSLAEAGDESESSPLMMIGASAGSSESTSPTADPSSSLLRLSLSGQGDECLEELDADARVAGGAVLGVGEHAQESVSMSLTSTRERRSR
jgi:hypothetical protein